MRLRSLAWILGVAALAVAWSASAPAQDSLAGSEIVFRDAALGANPESRYWDAFAVPDSRPESAYGPLTEPRSGRRFPFRLVVRVRAADADAATRRFVVHFDRQDDEHLARLAGRLMAHLYWVGREYAELGVLPGVATYYDVWLTHDGQAGAEQAERNIWLYAVDQARAPAEWIRELAHEYGHVIFPRIGPYAEPEVWANGYYGERLLMKWLFANGFTNLWERQIDGNAYALHQIAPLRDRFLNDGPASPDSAKTDANGMEHYIGAILALEQMHDLTVLRALLRRMHASTAPSSLALAYEATLRDLPEKAFRVDGRVFVPARSRRSDAEGATGFERAMYWMYLLAGRWRLTIPERLPETVEVAYGPFKFQRVSAAPAGGTIYEADISYVREPIQWRQLSITAPEGVRMELTELHLSAAPR